MKIKTISAFVAAVAAAALFSSCGGGNKPAVESAPYESPEPEFSADSAYRYVAEQCEFGLQVLCGGY